MFILLLDFIIRKMKIRSVVMVLRYFIISLCEQNHVLLDAQTIEIHRDVDEYRKFE